MVAKKPKHKLVGADEHDIFSGWRHYYGWGKGTIRKIKRQFNKRVRRETKVNIKDIE